MILPGENKGSPAMCLRFFGLLVEADVFEN